MNIVLFSNNLMPKEHFFGLLVIAQEADFVGKVSVFGSLSSEDFREFERLSTDKVNYLPTASFFKKVRSIASSDLVFGFPSELIGLRFLSRLGLLKFRSIFFGPGFVTKAVGYFKHPERGVGPSLRTLIKFEFLNTFFVCANELDRIYLAAALGYPLKRTISARLPKHIYINSELARNSEREEKKALLVAPTHRWDDVIPPLTKLMMDQDSVSELLDMGFEVFHSSHPETPQVALDRRVKIFDQDWAEVNCVVTDYSSIGDDFLLAGGRNVVLFVPDQKEFERNQGLGPFFENLMDKKSVERDLLGLMQFLRKVADSSGRDKIKKLKVDDYFDKLLVKFN